MTPELELAIRAKRTFVDTSISHCIKSLAKDAFVENFVIEEHDLAEIRGKIVELIANRCDLSLDQIYPGIAPNEARFKHSPDVVIVVRGGLVDATFVHNPSSEIVVIDWDNEDEEGQPSVNSEWTAPLSDMPEELVKAIKVWESQDEDDDDLPYCNACTRTIPDSEACNHDGNVTLCEDCHNAL